MKRLYVEIILAVLFLTGMAAAVAAVAAVAAGAAGVGARAAWGASVVVFGG